MQYEIKYEFVTKGYRGEFITEEETAKFTYYATEEEIVEELVEILKEQYFETDNVEESLTEFVECNIDYLYETYEEEVKQALEDKAREEFEDRW